jgi:tetratricopeptide (TPR) repeat protein
LDEPEDLKQLNISLEIDPFYDWTYGLLGDYVERYQVENSEADSKNWRDALEHAAGYYKNALEYADANNSSFKLNYAISLAGIQLQLGQIQDAIRNYEMALEISPENSENWKIHETLARLYSQIGDSANAISNALAAFNSAPDDQKSRLRDLISELGG